MDELDDDWIEHLHLSRTPGEYRFRCSGWPVTAMGPLTQDNAASMAAWCGGGVNHPILDCVWVPDERGFGEEAHLGDFIVCHFGRYLVRKPLEFANDFKPMYD